MNDRRHLILLSRIALLVTVGDLLTKAVAKSLIAGESITFAPWLHFAVMHNTQGAFGWSVGLYTWQLNLALTLAAIALMIPVTRDLARVDASAPRALGLIVGGALGNLASLVTSPDGVIDFIQLEHVGLAINVADVAAYAGLVMIMRTGALLVAALRSEGRVNAAARASARRTVFAERAILAQNLRLARSINADVREATVHDWSRVAVDGVVRADAPAPTTPDVVQIGDVADLRRLRGTQASSSERALADRDGAPVVREIRPGNSRARRGLRRLLDDSAPRNEPRL